MPDFVIIPKPDPVEVLWRHFPELKQQLGEGDPGPYYIYGIFADHLAASPHDDALWSRAHAFFDELATGAGDLPDFLVLGIYENLPGTLGRLSGLGPEPRKLWIQFRNHSALPS